MKLQLQFFGGRGSNSRMSGNLITEGSSQFGNPGVYQAYRAGGIFESPLGFLSFGMNPDQSIAYEGTHNSSTERYTLDIRNPLKIQGTDFDKMQDDLALKYTGKRYTEGRNLTEQRRIMKQASQVIESLGYDSILMQKTNKLTGKSTYEIGVLNGSRAKVLRR